MSATEVIAELKALPESERDRVLSYLVADAELREDLQDSITLEARRHEPSRPLADVLNDLDIPEGKKKLARAAEALRDDYTGNKDLTAFTTLDGEPLHAQG
jgi:hypothetical protein